MNWKSTLLSKQLYSIFIQSITLTIVILITPAGPKESDADAWINARGVELLFCQKKTNKV